MGNCGVHERYCEQESGVVLQWVSDFLTATLGGFYVSCLFKRNCFLPYQCSGSSPFLFFTHLKLLGTEMDVSDTLFILSFVGH